MSDSSISSVENERIAARLRLMCPGGRWEIFEDAAGIAEGAEGLDAFCLIARSRPPEVPGFVLRLEKQHRIPERLGCVVERFLQRHGLPGWLGMLCRPDSMVGGRICQTAVPDAHDVFFVRSGFVETEASPASDRTRDLACSVFGLGHLPLVGATAASFAVVVLGFVMSAFLGSGTWIIVMLLLAAAATAVCALLERWAHHHYLAEDPREVVLDEVAGMALTLAIAGPGVSMILAAFFAFRFFDIFKPGIHWVEERGWPGTIVWDDLLAGLYAGGAITFGFFIISFIFS